MAGEWINRRIGTLGRVVTGKTPSTADAANFGGPYPFITIPDLDGSVWINRTVRTLSDRGARTMKSSLLPRGAVMMSCIATVGRSGITARPSFTNQQINSVIPTAEVDPRFLYYGFTQLGQALDFAGGGGSVYTNVSKSRFSDIEISLPADVNEQRSIAHVLGALDDKIELNRRTNETLEAIARALFKSWFVDFDPVHAKAEGRDPGLPKHLADLFPDSFEDSELGEIPKGWHVRVLYDVLAELETGGRPKGGVSGYTTGIPSIGAESIVGLGVFDYSKTKYVPREFFAGMTKGRVQSRDVLLYKDGGRPGEFEPHVTLFGDGFPFGTCAINEHVYRIRATEELGQNLLFFWLSSDLVMEEMRIKGTGVAIPGLNSTQVKSLTTLVPPREVAQAFDVLVEPWITRVLATCNESHTLIAIRDTLLPKLISGELRLKDAERLVKGASA